MNSKDLRQIQREIERERRRDARDNMIATVTFVVFVIACLSLVIGYCVLH